MSLLFNMLSRLVITFLPRSKHLLISWPQSSSVVILEPPKIKSDQHRQHIKKQRHYFVNKGPSSQSYGFFICGSWTIKKAEHQRIDAFELWYGRRFLRVSWTARRSEDKMVGWHHRLNGHEFEQIPGDGEGQGILVYCSPWGCKESDMTE